MNPSQILFGPAPTSNSCGGVVAACVCVLFAGWRIRQKIFSFFFGARCAHAVCPGSHLWESTTGIIKNHQPINFFLSCGQYPASPRTFFFFFDCWLAFYFTREEKKEIFIYLFTRSLGRELTPATLNRRSSSLWVRVWFLQVDLHSWPCDEGVWLVTQAEENFFLPVCGCSPLTLLTNLHHERNLSPRSELVCGACYECAAPIHFNLVSLCE